MGIVDKFYKDNIEKRDVKRLIQSYKLNDVYEKKTATGEADQDYDKELFDKIVMQLDSAGITGATHREFDKYQGPYLYIPDVDKFWIDDVFTEGEKREEDISKPYKSAKLYNEEGDEVSSSKGDYFMQRDNYVFEDYILVLTKQNGEKIEIEDPKVSDLPDITDVMISFQYKPGTELVKYIFFPQYEPDIKLVITERGEVVNASELVDYAKEVLGRE